VARGPERTTRTGDSGFDTAIARQAAHQFLKGKDPGIGTLRKFAEAAGIPIEELVAGPKKPSKPKK
jgi:hypothetical protein